MTNCGTNTSPVPLQPHLLPKPATNPRPRGSGLATSHPVLPLSSASSEAVVNVHLPGRVGVKRNFHVRPPAWNISVVIFFPPSA